MTDDTFGFDRLAELFENRRLRVGALALGFVGLIGLVASPIVPVATATLAAVRLAFAALVVLGVAEVVLG